MKRMSILGSPWLPCSRSRCSPRAGASANPHWYECAKVTGGKFEKGCATEGGKGGFELKEGIGKAEPFKGKGKSATLHTVIPGKGDIKIECASFKDSGRSPCPTRSSMSWPCSPSANRSGPRAKRKVARRKRSRPKNSPATSAGSTKARRLQGRRCSTKPRPAVASWPRSNAKAWPKSVSTAA